MRKTTKIWLIIAVSLVLVGCIVFGTVMSVIKWDFKKLSTVKYQTNFYEITENFNDISIKTDTADVIFAVSDDGKCKVGCYEGKKEKHFVNVYENTLVINVVNEKSWYDYIGINIGTPKITVYLPKTEYNSVVINLSTGDISLENLSVGSLDFKVSTGDVDLKNIQCNSILSSGSTGDITLKDVIAKEKFSIKRSTGDVKFYGCDAGEITVETDTGDVSGSLLSEKVFVTKTSTGKISVPNTVTGGKCEIKTSTGDIKITCK